MSQARINEKAVGLRRRIAAIIAPDMADEARSYQSAVEDLAQLEGEGSYQDGYDEGNSDLKAANADTFAAVTAWLRRRGVTFDQLDHDGVTAQDIVDALDLAYEAAKPAAEASGSGAKAALMRRLRSRIGRWIAHEDRLDSDERLFLEALRIIEGYVPCDPDAGEIKVNGQDMRLATPPAPAVETGYRLLTVKDVVQKGDQVLSDDTVSWRPLSGWEIGMAYRPALLMPVRRAALAAPATDASEGR